MAQDGEFPYGRPGRPLRRGPFMFAIVGTVGVLVTLAMAIGVRRAGTILEILVGAVFGVLLAVPIYASVQLIVREVLLPRQDGR